MSAYDRPSRIWLGEALVAALRDHRWPDELPDISTFAPPGDTHPFAQAAQARADADPRMAKLVHAREVLGLTWARAAAETGYSNASVACAAYKAYQRRREERAHAAD